MDTMKWLQLATSKDKTRFNLGSIYRAKNCLVATDGHRLHMSNGLIDATPHYLDGLDADFPDFAQVLPTKTAVSIVQISSGSVKILQKLMNLIKKRDKWNTISLSVTREHEQSKEPRAKGTIQYLDPDLLVNLDLNIGELEGIPFNLSVNLAYLVDALSMADDHLVTLEYRGQFDPILIKHEANTAMLMPLKENK